MSLGGWHAIPTLITDRDGKTREIQLEISAHLMEGDTLTILGMDQMIVIKVDKGSAGDIQKLHFEHAQKCVYCGQTFGNKHPEVGLDLCRVDSVMSS